MKIITCTKLMDKALKSIATRGKTLDKDIHVMAVSAAMHVVKEGDCTYVNRTVSNMPKGSRSIAVMAWFETFAPVAWDDENSVFTTDKANAKSMKTELSDRELPLSIVNGIDKSWVECKPEQPYHGLDFTALIAKAVKSAEKRLKEIADGDTHAGNKIDAKMLASVKALLPTK